MSAAPSLMWRVRDEASVRPHQGLAARRRAPGTTGTQRATTPADAAQAIRDLGGRAMVKALDAADRRDKAGDIDLWSHSRTAPRTMSALRPALSPDTRLPAHLACRNRNTPNRIDCYASLHQPAVL